MVHKILKILTTYGVRLEQINIQHTNKISGSGCELVLFTLLLFPPFVNIFIHSKLSSEEKSQTA
jgi:hypothetical protein